LSAETGMTASAPEGSAGGKESVLIGEKGSVVCGGKAVEAYPIGHRSVASVHNAQVTES
jgi:hypothetical protein